MLEYCGWCAYLECCGWCVYLEYCGWCTWNAGEPVKCWNTVGGVRTWMAGEPVVCWNTVGGVRTWNAAGSVPGILVSLEYCNTVGGVPGILVSLEYCNTVGGVRTWNAAGGAPLLCGRWESPGCLPWCAPSTCLQGSAQASKGALNVYQCCAHTASITNGTVNYGA